MSNQPRAAKVWVSFVLSMTIGAVVLMALDSNHPSAGPFCLSSYYRLDSIDKTIRSAVAQRPSRWDSIEIYHSRTKAGNIEQLASLSGASPDEINCHFVICNGLGGGDGQIQATERWQRQWSIVPGGKWYGSGTTIRICVIADVTDGRPTNLQVRRTEALVETLCRKFEISPQSIYYPGNWQ